jgi:hypothetical protein
MRGKVRSLGRKLEDAGFNLWNNSLSLLPITLDPHSEADFYPQDLTTTEKSVAPFVPSPIDVVREMLELAKLQPGEVLFDLGCGDGRIVLMAAKEFGSKAIGVDLNAGLVVEAKLSAEKLGLKNASFIDGNMFDVDLSSADVVTMYLMTRANEKLRPKLESELKRGARVVTHDFPISSWSIDRQVEFNVECRKHTLYMYLLRDAG